MIACRPNPYRTGKKSYAYELADQLDGHSPDWVLHPTAGGTGILCMWQGFKEFAALGWIDRLPKLAAYQSAMAPPIVNAFERGLEEVAPVIAKAAVAESIQVGNPAHWVGVRWLRCASPGGARWP